MKAISNISVIPKNSLTLPPVPRGTLLNLVDGMTAELNFCRGCILSVEGATTVTGTESDFEGPITLLEAHFDRLEKLAAIAIALHEAVQS